MPEPIAKPPANQALAVVKQLSELWSRQPKRRRVLAIAVVAGVLGLVAIASLTKHVESWSAAVDGLSPDDANELYAALVARGLPARMHEGKVEVHDDDMEQARAIAATAGLPFAGKGFELFDGNNLGQSSFAEQVNYRRALQGELARSITTLAQVEAARVHLAIGKRSVFKDQEVAPSASVALRLHAGQTLTAEQVKGIRQLVAASLEGLKPEAVAIVDNHGNLLDAAEPTTGTRQADVEHGVAERVRQILERVVGAGHVSVVASADVDGRKVSETEDVYDKDRTALRSENRTVEGDAPAGDGSASGVAGVRGNLPGATPAAIAPGSPGNGKLQETRNYEVTHTVRQTTSPETTLVRLHVAVLVDEAKGADGKPVARTKEQMAELVALARQAAGIDDARGDVLELQSVAFAPEEDALALPPAEPAPWWPPLPLPVLIGAGVAAIALLAGLAFALRRILRRKQPQTALIAHGRLAFPTPIAELERALDSRPAIDLPAAPEPLGLPAGKSAQERVMDAVRADVERAAGVLTAWLHEPAAKGVK